MLRIGVLWPGASPPAPSFYQTLSLLGFVENRNVVVELRNSATSYEGLFAFAGDVRLRA
jgi:hypothetical protein